MSNFPSNIDSTFQNALGSLKKQEIVLSKHKLAVQSLLNELDSNFDENIDPHRLKYDYQVEILDSLHTKLPSKIKFEQFHIEKSLISQYKCNSLSKLEGKFENLHQVAMIRVREIMNREVSNKFFFYLRSWVFLRKLYLQTKLSRKWRGINPLSKGLKNQQRFLNHREENINFLISRRLLMSWRILWSKFFARVRERFHALQNEELGYFHHLRSNFSYWLRFHSLKSRLKITMSHIDQKRKLRLLCLGISRFKSLAQKNILFFKADKMHRRYKLLLYLNFLKSTTQRSRIEGIGKRRGPNSIRRAFIRLQSFYQMRSKSKCAFVSYLLRSLKWSLRLWREMARRHRRRREEVLLGLQEDPTKTSPSDVNTFVLQHSSFLPFPFHTLGPIESSHSLFQVSADLWDRRKLKSFLLRWKTYHLQSAHNKMGYTIHILRIMSIAFKILRNFSQMKKESRIKYLNLHPPSGPHFEPPQSNYQVVYTIHLLRKMSSAFKILRNYSRMKKISRTHLLEHRNKFQSSKSEMGYTIHLYRKMFSAFKILRQYSRMRINSRVDLYNKYFHSNQNPLFRFIWTRLARRGLSALYANVIKKRKKQLSQVMLFGRPDPLPKSSQGRNSSSDNFLSDDTSYQNLRRKSSLDLELHPSVTSYQPRPGNSLPRHISPPSQMLWTQNQNAQELEQTIFFRPIPPASSFTHHSQESIACSDLTEDNNSTTTTTTTTHQFDPIPPTSPLPFPLTHPLRSSAVVPNPVPTLPALTLSNPSIPKKSLPHESISLSNLESQKIIHLETSLPDIKILPGSRNPLSHLRIRRTLEILRENVRTRKNIKFEIKEIEKTRLLICASNFFKTLQFKTFQSSNSHSVRKVISTFPTSFSVPSLSKWVSSRIRSFLKSSHNHSVQLGRNMNEVCGHLRRKLRIYFGASFPPSLTTLNSPLEITIRFWNIKQKLKFFTTLRSRRMTNKRAFETSFSFIIPKLKYFRKWKALSQKHLHSSSILNRMNLHILRKWFRNWTNFLNDSRVDSTRFELASRFHSGLLPQSLLRQRLLKNVFKYLRIFQHSNQDKKRIQHFFQQNNSKRIMKEAFAIWLELHNHFLNLLLKSSTFHHSSKMKKMLSIWKLLLLRKDKFQLLRVKIQHHQMKIFHIWKLVLLRRKSIKLVNRKIQLFHSKGLKQMFTLWKSSQLQRKRSRLRERKIQSILSKRIKMMFSRWKDLLLSRKQFRRNIQFICFKEFEEIFSKLKSLLHRRKKSRLRERKIQSIIFKRIKMMFSRWKFLLYRKKRFLLREKKIQFIFFKEIKEIFSKLKSLLHRRKKSRLRERKIQSIIFKRIKMMFSRWKSYFQRRKRFRLREKKAKLHFTCGIFSKWSRFVQHFKDIQKKHSLKFRSRLPHQFRTSHSDYSHVQKNSQSHLSRYLFFSRALHRWKNFGKTNFSYYQATRVSLSFHQHRLLRLGFQTLRYLPNYFSENNIYIAKSHFFSRGVKRSFMIWNTKRKYSILSSDALHIRRNNLLSQSFHRLKEFTKTKIITIQLVWQFIKTKEKNLCKKAFRYFHCQTQRIIAGRLLSLKRKKKIFSKWFNVFRKSSALGIMVKYLNKSRLGDLGHTFHSWKFDTIMIQTLKRHEIKVKKRSIASSFLALAAFTYQRIRAQTYIETAIHHSSSYRIKVSLKKLCSLIHQKEVFHQSLRKANTYWATLASLQALRYLQNQSRNKQLILAFRRIHQLRRGFYLLNQNVSKKQHFRSKGSCAARRSMLRGFRKLQFRRLRPLTREDENYILTYDSRLKLCHQASCCIAMEHSRARAMHRGLQHLSKLVLLRNGSTHFITCCVDWRMKRQLEHTLRKLRKFARKKKKSRLRIFRHLEYERKRQLVDGLNRLELNRIKRWDRMNRREIELLFRSSALKRGLRAFKELKENPQSYLTVIFR